MKLTHTAALAPMTEFLFLPMFKSLCHVFSELFKNQRKHQVTYVTKKYLLKTILLLLLVCLPEVYGQTIQLSFPLPNRDATTATINTVFDHSMTDAYTADGKVVAFTGEEGRIEYGQDLATTINGTALYGYKNNGGTSFLVNGHYAGGGSPTYLYYEGHPGFDFRTTDQSPSGQINVLAAADGTAHWIVGSSYNTLWVDHGNGYTTHYLHLSSRIAADGAAVTRGQIIGVSGDTGASGSPHLHFEVHLNGVPVDPYGWQGGGLDPYTRAVNVWLWAKNPYLGEVVTNIMSPIVSYQYPEDFNSQALANGGILSPMASYQYLEWPGNDVISLQYSPTVSYYWPLSSILTPMAIHGRVTSTDGTPIPKATVWATIYLAPLAQATTDANGYYQMLSLDAGVYTLWATAASRQTSIRGLTLNASTAAQDFQLNPMPLPPAMQQVSRQSVLPSTLGPMGSALRVFDGTQFVPITAGNKPPSDRMTIVLTHGWVQGTPDPTVSTAPFALWPVDMATAMRAHGVTPALANIVAWDWRYAATDPPPTPSDASDQTPIQGVALGKALLATLLSGYAQPIHFVGHSLGTLVNAAAANYLHGDRIATVRQEVSPTPWASSRTHMTLLDQAQIAEIAGRQVLFDGLNPTALDAFNAAAGYSSPQNWQNPLPVHFKWADNYVSIVGATLPGAVNVMLQKSGAIASPVDAHGYPIQWYIDSISRPTVGTLGFQHSFDYNRVVGTSDANFPPADFAIGSTYDQASLSSDPLILSFYANNTFQPLGIFPDAVVQSLVGAEQYAGNVLSYVVDREITGAERTWQQISQGFNYTLGVAAEGAQTVVDFSGSAMLQFLLSTTPTALLTPMADANFGGATPVPMDNIEPSSPPMIWLPVLIPTNSVAMAFDFTISGDPVDDSLVCGIDTNNLFSLPAKYIPTNTISASRLIDVSAWTGQTKELFFGFLGGTSTNATLTIQNIRFYSLQSPLLNIMTMNGTYALTWPSSSGGYVIESTPSLSSPTWETFTNTPTIFGDSYMLTNNWSGQTRFFRLRQQ